MGPPRVIGGYESATLDEADDDDELQWGRRE